VAKRKNGNNLIEQAKTEKRKRLNSMWQKRKNGNNLIEQAKTEKRKQLNSTWQNGKTKTT
jgi:hypothetical protein